LGEFGRERHAASVAVCEMCGLRGKWVVGVAAQVGDIDVFDRIPTKCEDKGTQGRY